MKYLLIAITFVFALSEVAAATEVEEPAPAPKLQVGPANLGRTYEEARMDALVAQLHSELKAKKFERAKLMVKAAKQGNPKACNLVGWMFDNGVAVKKDPAKALKWFEYCSDRSPLAAYNAGVLYGEGRGTTRNPGKMAEYYAKAWSFDVGSFRGMMPQIPIRLAYYHYSQKSYTEAWEWAERASDLDTRYGKYLTGRMLAEKTSPFEDKARAISDLNASMEAGNATAAALLAWCYSTGALTKKDQTLAHEYHLIANKIDPRAFPQQIYSAGLTDEQKRKAEARAAQWRQMHGPGSKVDFKTTLDGTEKQFSGK